MDEGRALLDARIAKMEESLRALKQERNTYCHAVRVPPEILTHIFLDVIDDIYESNGERTQQFYPPHVCRYWYEVALCSQEYWRYQPLYSGGELGPPDLLERARGRPLHLWGRFSANDQYWDSPGRDYILSQAESVNICLYHHFDTDDVDIPRFMKTFLKGCAPNLRSLTLSAESVNWVTIPEDTAAFGGNFPCLRFLSLECAEWSWRTPIFVSPLTHLILFAIIPWDDACIETLQQLSSLRYLDLAILTEPDGADTSFEPPTDPPSVKLENLEVLRLHGAVRLLGVLALELNIPLSASISFTADYPDDVLHREPFELEPLLLWLSRHLQRLDQASIPVHTMYIDSGGGINSSGTLRFHYSPDSIIDPVKLPKAESALPHLEIELYRESYRVFFNAILPMIILKLQLSTVQALCLNNLNVFPFDNEAALRSLAGVQALCFSATGTMNMPSGIISATRRHQGVMLLPALKTVVLHKTDFDRKFEDVISFFAERSKGGHPVEKVYLSQCKHVQEECLQTLRQHASTVEWDGLDLSKIGNVDG